MLETIKLNSGYEMPTLGIGTYILSSMQAENSVYWALKTGYRLIDTARIYGNEDGVGRGIRRAIEEGFVKREEIFVTTKMWTSDFDHGDEAIDASLRKLGLSYIDLMLLHHSQPRNDIKAYRAMERAVSSGKLRSIGISNFYTPSDFDRFIDQVSIMPAVLQNEVHPYHQNKDMVDHISKVGTRMESWFPVGGKDSSMWGSTKNKETLFKDPVIRSIAQKHGKTPAQVILRWHLQDGYIAIPGSSCKEHIQEDFDLFDFALTEDEMEQFAKLERNERFSGY